LVNWRLLHRSGERRCPALRQPHLLSGPTRNQPAVTRVGRGL